MGWKFLTRRSTLIEAQHCANLLESIGIRAQVRNRFLSGALGEIPQVEAWPQVWIPEGRDTAETLAALEAAAQDLSDRAPHWACESCGEWIEPQFAACWQCGAPRRAP
ncbi:MAG: DUF2007 domain-containing protein [Rhodocyclaceae bacterium]|nr:DUF2007 domain-containing protein [Rhodocyclaceae bacterium]